MNETESNRDVPIDPKLEDFATAFDTSLASGHTLPETPPADADQKKLYEYARRSLLALERAFPRQSSRAALDLVTGRGNVGKFEIRRELGRGGNGIVFLAFDTEARREVALKLPRWENLVDPAARQRFLDEARLALRLEHPGIVRVYEVGEIGAVAFIASEYAGDVTLSAWRDSRINPVPPRLAAQIAAYLADAAAYLHSQKLVHCDIKPDNVILQTSSASQPLPAELLGVGIPKLTDFGLVRRHSSEFQTGIVAGTPEYMAPEQALGKEDEIGPPTDVFALSVILYELITGRTPFHGRNKFDTVQRMLNEVPRRLKHYRSDVPCDLEAICLKGLARQSSRRYPSARELHQDLQAFLAGERPIARRELGWRQLMFCLTPRQLIVSVIVLALVMLVVGVLAFTFWSHSSKRYQAEALVQELLVSDEEQLPVLIQKLRNTDLSTRQMVVSKFEQDEVSRLQQFRFALVAAESSPAAQEFLAQQVLNSSPQEFRLIMEVWETPPRAAIERWQQVFHAPLTDSSTRFRAGLSLCRFGESDSSSRGELIALLLEEPHPAIPVWARLLPRLIPDFKASLRTEVSFDQLRLTSVAYSILLAEVYADQLGVLVAELRSAAPAQLPYYLAKLRRFGPEAVAACRQTLNHYPPTARAADVETAKLRANFICALSQLGESQVFEQYLRHGTDPTERFRIIHTMAASGQNPQQLLTVAQQTQDAGTLYALLIALGEYPVIRIPSGLRGAAAVWLREVAASYPDSGVHAVARWLANMWFGKLHQSHECHFVNPSVENKADTLRRIRSRWSDCPLSRTWQYQFTKSLADCFKNS